MVPIILRTFATRGNKRRGPPLTFNTNESFRQEVEEDAAAIPMQLFPGDIIDFSNISRSCRRWEIFRCQGFDMIGCAGRNPGLLISAPCDFQERRKRRKVLRPFENGGDSSGPVDCNGGILFNDRRFAIRAFPDNPGFDYWPTLCICFRDLEGLY